MNFKQWVDEQRGQWSVHSVLAPLATKCGLSKATLYSVYKGMRLKFYDKALSLSKTTGGRVKVKELVE